MMLTHNLNFIYFAFLIILSSCKFNISPYSADTPDLKLNMVNLERIKASEPEDGPSYKIALISDTHNYYSDLDDLVKAINASGPYSFVIIAGDITNLGHLDEYNMARRYFNRLKFPYLVAMGNHDVISNGEKIFKRMFGEGNFAFEYKNANFIFLDANNWESGGKVPDMEWVEERLIAFNSPYKIIVSHVPLTDEDRFSNEQMSEWESMLSNQGVQFLLNGHNHNPTVGAFAGATMITIGASSKRKFFELIYNGGFTYQKISF
jgi:3',5'-cyclic-AMP phosphodiesterase